MVTWPKPRPEWLKVFRQCVSQQNSECVPLSIGKFWRASQILNLGHMTLAALTNLDHVTRFLLLGPPYHLTIQWVKRNHFTGQQITRSDRSSHKIWHSCRENSFAFKSLFICTAAPLSMLLENSNHKGRFVITTMQNSRLIWLTNECFWIKVEYMSPGQTDPKGVQPLPILLLGPARHLTKQWVT